MVGFEQFAVRLSLGFVLSALIGCAAYRRGLLCRSGLVGALLIGTVTLGLGGWSWGVLLVAFFLSSSVFSRVDRGLKESLTEKFSKGSRRDLAQTLANGGLGTLIASLHFFAPAPWMWVAFSAAIATVTADTWATELGVLSRSRPRLITTGKEVETGTSGGITWVGTSASLAGAMFIGLLAAALTWMGDSKGIGIGALWNAAGVFLVVALAGLFGSLFDSWIGATVQAVYFCAACGKETEHHPTHRCGSPTRLLRGWRWLDNDGVNFLSSLAGAVVAVSAVFGVEVWQN